jgi:hypothetical protein
MKRQKEKLHLLLNERRQCEKATYCIITTIRHSGKSTTAEMTKRSVPREDGVEWGKA